MLHITRFTVGEQYLLPFDHFLLPFLPFLHLSARSCLITLGLREAQNGEKQSETGRITVTTVRIVAVPGAIP